ncbi:MAG: transglutaminaseTgpA domain-containing protein [Egibacteraceae bacterium]
MSASSTLRRTHADHSPAQPSPGRDRRDEHRARPRTTPSQPFGLLAVTAALIVAASLPLTRVLVGPDVLRPVVGATLGVLALGWVVRRLRGGPLVQGLVQLVGLGVYAGLLFLPETLAVRVIPTLSTLLGLSGLIDMGLELVQLRPAPALADPPLMMLAVGGVWLVAMAVDAFVHQASAPGRASASAILLWSVPLALAPSSARPWLWALVLLVPIALLLLAFADAELRHTKRVSSLGRPTGWAVAAVALIAAVAAAPLMPGYEGRAWYELRGRSGVTLTTNPIVSLRPSLTAQDTGPVLRVTSDQPVYLRTTALDIYDENEEWTNAGIRGRPVHAGIVPFAEELSSASPLRVTVELVGLDGAVLAPTPYQPRLVTGPAAGGLQYDTSTATFTTGDGATLSRGDSYSVTAAVPTPAADRLDELPSLGSTGALTALPENIPPEVAATARRIVERANAQSPFRQALAIQRELRSWTYSLRPPQGHSAAAMSEFLRTRTGYCEQFAGTMAVMLRTLGLPARVAVGFTPGELVDPQQGIWNVSNANAHAWVEVLFPGYGWVSFEPTPRRDGNVLVPTATNLTPSSTESDPTQLGDGAAAGEQQLPFAQVGEEQRLANRASGDQLTGGIGPQGEAQAGSPTTRLPLTLAVLGAAALALLIAVRLRRSDAGHADPTARVLATRAHLDRVGRGLGQPPLTSETDREYLRRLSAAATGDTTLAARLATRLEQARWAPAVTPTAAAEAESAAHTLVTRLLDPLGRASRAVVAVRGTAATGWSALRARRTTTRRAGRAAKNSRYGFGSSLRPRPRRS